MIQNNQVQHTGIFFKILSAKSIKSQYPVAQQQFYTRVEVLKNIKQTSLVSGDNVQWNQGFYYNTHQIVDDDIKFTLIGRNVIGQAIVTFSKIKKALKIPDYQIQLKYNGVKTAILVLEISYYVSQEIIGAVQIPDLSLVPTQPIDNQVPIVVPAIEPEIKGFTIQKVRASKRNFYSCMDDLTIPDWQLFPHKFKQRYQ